MKIIKLPFIETLNSNLKNSPQFIQVILGARQVGKTTGILNYLKTNFKVGEYYYVSAEKELSSGLTWILEHWQKARMLRQLLVIDEIQKIENWAEHIKKLWDEEKIQTSLRGCVLLSSSSLKLQKGLTESLAGRFQLISVFHWNYKESYEAYKLSFDDYLKYGGYPGSYPLISDEKIWISYLKHSIVEAVIEKDILNFQNIKAPALFKQAFEILIAYPAQELSYTKLLGQLQDKGNTDLIKRYLNIFENAYLIKALEKYSNKAVIKKSSSPKILPLCPAFYFLSIQNSLSPDEKGRAFELVVGMQLNRLDGELYYWREKNKELDYVFKKGASIYAIECKSGRKKTNSGMSNFIKQFPKAKPIIISLENYQNFESDPLKFLENT